MIKVVNDDKAALAVKQCAGNIFAILNTYGLPPVSIVANQSDRIMATVPDLFKVRMMELAMTRNPSGSSLLPYFDRWDFVRDHGLTAVGGWRENVATYSMQVIEHDTGVWEFDVDVCNPNFGLAPIFGHLIECVVKGKTDPFKVCRGLNKRGIKVEQLA